MEPFPRRERERERDASKTQLHCPSKTISQPLRASARTGGTSQTVVHRLKEHTAFFSLSGVSWTTKKENSFGDSFVVWHFPKVSNWPSPLLQFKHLCLCHSLARHLRYNCRWMGIYRRNKHRLAQMSKHAAKTHSVDKQFVGRHRHSLTHTHVDFLIQQNSHACAHTFTDSGEIQINTYPCRVLM